MKSQKPWFKTKMYGWGWTPAAWQGWLILVGFVAIVVWNFFRIDAQSHSNSDTLRPFIIQTVTLTLILIWVCEKTGEKPRWKWGNKN